MVRARTIAAILVVLEVAVETAGIDGALFEGPNIDRAPRRSNRGERLKCLGLELAAMCDDNSLVDTLDSAFRGRVAVVTVAIGVRPPLVAVAAGPCKLVRVFHTIVPLLYFTVDVLVVTARQIFRVARLCIARRVFTLLVRARPTVRGGHMNGARAVRASRATAFSAL